MSIRRKVFSSNMTRSTTTGAEGGKRRSGKTLHNCLVTERVIGNGLLGHGRRDASIQVASDDRVPGRHIRGHAALRREVIGAVRSSMVLQGLVTRYGCCGKCPSGPS
jgi:hypothetical protein